MRMQRTNRLSNSGAALACAALCVLFCLPAGASAQRGVSRGNERTPQNSRRTVAAPPSFYMTPSQASRQQQPSQNHSQMGRPCNSQPRPGHLGSWMEQHQNLDPQAQQRALEHEPGFNQLPPDQQARMRARLQQLNQMPPQQRAQVLNRVEGMERLTPEQRQHVNATMTQLRALPPDQKQQVTRAFGAIRQMPPEQREAAARNFSGQMNPQQRDAFN